MMEGCLVSILKNPLDIGLKMKLRITFFFVIREWMKAIIHVMATKGSEWTEEHPHGSYAPVRQNTVTQW